MKGDDGVSDGDDALLDNGLSINGEDAADSDTDGALEMDCFPEDVASALQGLLAAAADPSTFAAPSEDMGAASRSALEVSLLVTCTRASKHAAC